MVVILARDSRLHMVSLASNICLAIYLTLAIILANLQVASHIAHLYQKSVS